MHCPNCQSEYPETTITCTKCGFPFTATDQEKSAFIAKQILKAGEIGDANNAVKSSRLILFAIGVINILYAVIFYTDVLSISIYVLLGLGFCMFGYLVTKSPMQILLFALSVLLFTHTVTAIIDISYLMIGLRWKIFCFMGVGYSIVVVWKAQKIKKESEYLSKIE